MKKTLFKMNVSNQAATPKAGHRLALHPPFQPHLLGIFPPTLHSSNRNLFFVSQILPSCSHLNYFHLLFPLPGNNLHRASHGCLLMMQILTQMWLTEAHSFWLSADPHSPSISPSHYFILSFTQCYLELFVNVFIIFHQ